MERFAGNIYDTISEFHPRLPATLGGKIVLGTVVAVSSAGLLWRYYFRAVYFARFLSKAAPEADKRLGPRHRKFFLKLEELKAKRGDGKLVIIDVGSGSGVNFQYYPEDTEVICVDPNRHHEPFLRAGSETWPKGVHVGKYHVTTCERMHEIVEPDVADAVIAGGMLCFLPDMDLGLQEIYRVLKPGGMLFVLEHVLSPPDYPRRRLLQKLINPLWNFFMGGCNCNRYPEPNVRRAGFKNVNAEYFEAFELEQPTRFVFFIRLVRSRMLLTATK